jgi:hypothetical protein
MEVFTMITGIQIVAVIFSLAMTYVTFLHFKKRELAYFEALFFFLIWLGAILLTVFPKSIDFILTTFHIYRLLDLATIVGFMFLIGLAYKNYLEIKDLKRKIEKLVRDRSLKNLG